MIQLLNGLTKFKSITIKLYFIDSTFINDNQSISKSSVLILIEAPAIEKKPPKASSIEKLLIYIFTTLISLSSLVLLVKYGYRQPKKYLEKLLLCPN